MAIDKLQEKIRKLKNPSVIEISASVTAIPPHILTEEGSFSKAFLRFCSELMGQLKEIVPAVRVRSTSFALKGAQGLGLLSEVLAMAKRAGFYVFIDGFESFSRRDAEDAAEVLMSPVNYYPFDSVIVSPYIGSDVIKPYLKYMKDVKKDLFIVVRTGNKSASELQDLLSGTRVVHMAAAEIVSRLGEDYMGKCGYSMLGMVGSATAPDSLKSLRAKHEKVFLMVEGYDYPNANAKTSSYAFDQFGHGAVVSSSESVLAAWKLAETDGKDYVRQAVEAAERMKKNLLRYVTIM